MPSFHIIIGVDLLLVHAPAGVRPCRNCFVPGCYRHSPQTSAGVQWWLAAEDR